VAFVKTCYKFLNVIFSLGSSCCLTQLLESATLQQCHVLSSSTGQFSRISNTNRSSMMSHDADFFQNANLLVADITVG